MPDIFHYHETWTIPNHATQLQIMFGVGASGSARLVFYRWIASRLLTIIYWNGTANTQVELVDFFDATLTTVTADITINWLTGAYVVYKNGVQFATGTLTTPVKPSALVWYFGNQSALSSVQFCGGSVANRRWYNRALTANEIYSLYLNPSQGLNNILRTTLPSPRSYAMRDSDGNLQANGFKFPRTQVASSDANTLDDYEEGTFTPSVTFGGASVGLTGTFNGSYTKIGNRVFFISRIGLTSKGTSTGQALLTGLPFVSANHISNSCPCSMYFSLLKFANQAVCIVSANSFVVTLGEATEVGGFSNLMDSDFADTTLLIVSGHYYT